MSYVHDIVGQTGLNLLIVEDDTVISMDFEFMLEDLGHRVLGVAAHADRALAHIDRFGRRIDVAILDVRLGLQTSRPVADRLTALGIPYIVVSGMNEREVRSLGYRAGLVEKPCTQEDFRQALRDVKAAA